MQVGKVVGLADSPGFEGSCFARQLRTVDRPGPLWMALWSCWEGLDGFIGAKVGEKPMELLIILLD